MDKLKEVIDILSHLALGVTILATAVVQLTPTKSDDKKLDEFFKKLHKYLGILPTFGRSPTTKELLKEKENNIGE